MTLNLKECESCEHSAIFWSNSSTTTFCFERLHYMRSSCSKLNVDSVEGQMQQRLQMHSASQVEYTNAVLFISGKKKPNW